MRPAVCRPILRFTAVLSLLSAGRFAVVAKGPCDSPIYCEGELLHAVQMAKLFPDDKTFVDKPTLRPQSEVLASFAAIGGSRAPRESLSKFVGENFGTEGSELKPVSLTELSPNPAFLQNISDPLLRAFGLAVNAYWSTLVREQDLSVLCAGCVSSMLPLRYHFVVPGGRFREIYYWDTFFTLEGMLRSGLKELARSNIRDLLSLVNTFGFVPNGARLYYLDRSQPPMLALMVKLYYEFTADSALLAEALPLLWREHAYWQNNHSVDIAADGKSWPLSRYIVDTDQPRPEAYAKDFELAHNASTDPARQAAIYADMATGAESGWDYSTRWVKPPLAPVPSGQLLYTIRTRKVVPVELNAVLYQVEQTLADFALIVPNCSSPLDYRSLAQTRRDAMYAVFYDQPSGMFYDYLLDEQQKSSVFSPAALWPYWSFGHSRGSDEAFAFVDKLLNTNPGGIPATLNNSGQQWDFPSVWPPLQYVLMQGALATNNSGVAKRLAQAYVDSVFCAWYSTGGSIPGILTQLSNQTDAGHMFEKFDSTVVGKQGGGGEYTVQAGFGWTNGVLLWTLDNFGHCLVAPSCPPPSSSSSAPSAGSPYSYAPSPPAPTSSSPV
ncbi:hypothetical protein GGI04_002391 [Coemansia thaxteri]|nr:hypothetical protein GGI04_002391 [Coemansia thaxteri]KAJ2471626.1 hypothetical protein GGI02_002145 [Coemansia sp. RSA 2322]